jgi:sugar porter (SP) family MFS transporter
MGFGFKKDQRDLDAAAVSAFADASRRGNTEVGNVNGFSQNSRAYLMAVIAYLGIVLFGYDTGLGGGVLKLPSFIRDFGIHGNALYVANLSANIVSILQGGAFFGALGAAPVSNWIGRKWALMIFCWIFVLGGVLQVAGLTLSFLYAGRFFAGLGVGGLSSICPTYVGELAPRNIRANITGLFQVLVVIGVALSYWINYGVSFMDGKSSKQWRISVGFQLVPVGLMICLLPFIKESPRWLASKGRNSEALANLAWVRKRGIDSELVQLELAEIVAAVEEDKAATAGTKWSHEITRRGNPKRFFIAIVIFILQQWSGQNSINYYAPTIFNAIGIQGTSASLLASGVYGLVKIVATTAFVLFGIERAGRKKFMTFGAFWMGAFLFMIGAVFITHVPNPKALSPSGASIAMAVLIYLFVIPYCFSWGVMCWVICAEIFNTRSRAYGLAVASASQWLNNFAVSRATPVMVVKLPHGKVFFFFASVNVLSLIFALWMPETSKHSLEAMDVLFGATTLEEREAEIAAKAQRIENNVEGGSIGGGSIETEVEKYGHSEHFDNSALKEQRVANDNFGSNV